MWETPNGPYLHRFMVACITASMEMAIRQAGYKFLSQADIFAHPKCPDDIFESNHPLSLPHRNGDIIPDQLFGIDYGGKYRFFALEADRKTETLITTKKLAKAFGKKLEAYAYVLENQTIRQVWGIPTLSILTVTT